TADVAADLHQAEQRPAAVHGQRNAYLLRTLQGDLSIRPSGGRAASFDRRLSLPGHEAIDSCKNNSFAGDSRFAHLGDRSLGTADPEADAEADGRPAERRSRGHPTPTAVPAVRLRVVYAHSRGVCDDVAVPREHGVLRRARADEPEGLPRVLGLGPEGRLACR